MFRLYPDDLGKLRNLLQNLRVEQKEAADQLLSYDNGILCATTSFGKTVVSTYMIAQKKQDEDTFRMTSLKLMALLDAISMSGEGDEKESPLYVICVSDEYSFLRALGAKELLQQSLIETPSGHCDKMDFKIDVSSEDEEETSETTEKTITLYFNIELAFSKLSSIF